MKKTAKNKSIISKELFKTVSKAILFVDANTASCALMHQTKVPAELSKFKMVKKDEAL